MQMPKPRITDVAQVAGVSTATVSRALTQPDRLSEKTRQRVFDAIRTTGYRVNRAARNLRTQRAGAVLVLVPNLGNPFFSLILSSINDVFAANGYSVLVFDSQQPSAPDQVVSDYLFNGSADGVITLDGHMSATMGETLKNADLLRNVVFCCEWSDKLLLPSIRSDNPLGARLAVDHLVALGHRKIAHVTGPSDNILARVRRSVFEDRCAHHGLSIAPDWIIPGDFTLSSGARAAERLIALADRPTAVFCASDEIALSLISRAQQAGLRVPEDLSVVGFDDIEIAGHVSPALTTIRQDRALLGRMAAEELLGRLQSDPSPHAVPISFAPVELITRSTTAPPPGR